MNIPGFTAESTLYRTKGRYQTLGRFGQLEHLWAAACKNDISPSTQPIVPASFPRDPCNFSELLYL